MPLNILRSIAAERKRRRAIEREAAEVVLVHKHGFPAGTSETAALTAARLAARTAMPLGEILSEEIVQSPEHEAAGEFLVRVTMGRRTGGSKNERGVRGAITSTG